MLVRRKTFSSKAHQLMDFCPHENKAIQFLCRVKHIHNMLKSNIHSFNGQKIISYNQLLLLQKK